MMWRTAATDTEPETYMHNTIFKRYLKITMIIVVLSFILLGSTMMAFFTQYWGTEKIALLRQNAASVADLTSRVASYESDALGLDHVLLTLSVENYSKNMEADIFITDMEGEILIGSFYSSKRSEGGRISPEVMARIEKGFNESKDTLGGFYDQRYYSVSVPFFSAKDENQTPIGMIFAATNASVFSNFRMEILEIFLIAALLVLALTFCVVGFFSYSLVKPLRQMSVAVKRFGSGDLSMRVPVDTQDEIGQLAHSINEMANSLSNSEIMRRSFVANVSHELKTPMTTISGFIDGILDGTIPPEQRDKYLKIVSDEVKRLSRLVKSMLDLSRIDSGEMRINPTCFNLTKTIVTTLLTFERSIEEKAVEIRGLEELGDQIIYGDQDLLHQVLYNLIENAVKFTNNDGYIQFRVIDGIDRTCIQIENSGAGIDAEELPMVFERFYKTDKSRSKDKNGMGLGLYIVRTIIKLHGGDITVESEAGSYCRFEFYIPKNEPKDTEVEFNYKNGHTIKESREEVFDAEIKESPSEESGDKAELRKPEGKKKEGKKQKEGTRNG